MSFLWGDAHCGTCSGHEVPVSAGLSDSLREEEGRGRLSIGSLITTVDDCLTCFIPV